jgi:hypothetical protein
MGELPQISGSSKTTPLFLLQLPAVCKAGGAPGTAFNSNPMPMVRSNILPLQALLERAGILL